MEKTDFTIARISLFEKIVLLLSNSLNWIACIALLAILLLTLLDIIANKVFSAPIKGGIEIVGLLCVIVISFSIAYTQAVHGHIEVELFVKRLSRKTQHAISSFISFFSLSLFSLLAWKSYDYGRTLQLSGEVSMTQQIPLYPFVYAISFCCIFVCLVVLVQWLRSITRT